MKAFDAHAREMPRSTARTAAASALAWAAFVLAGCGGGGGGGGGGGLPIFLPPTTTPPAADNDAIVASSTVAGLCAAPRGGTNPETGAAYPDKAGMLTDEKRWVRGWIDETYLWYGEVPATLKAADYATPVAYFSVLKSPAVTASGRAKDRFHYVYDTERYRQLSQNGVSPGYGMEFAFVRNSRPRDLRIAFTEPGSPAASAGIARGAKVLEVDGVDVINGTNTTVINRGISPAAIGESHTFKLQEGTATRTVTLAAASVTRTPVQNVKTIDTASGRVGYLLFNDHITTSEAQLIDAVNQLKAGSGIQDLVLDMRYNGGGQLNIASRLAYMASAPAATDGKTFERLVFNDKNPFHLTPAQTIIPFYGTSRTGTALPRLGLSQVTVLVGPDTCSASESVINSLRGVDVKVNLVGGATCGKPYGFSPQDNCGTSYFAIQFQGVNAKNFGDYGDGFPADCAVADDFDHALGDPAEARLAAALAIRTGGACPASASAKTAPGLEKSGTSEEQPYLLNRTPLREIRLLEAAPSPS
ncbi:carboxyl-terminal processing protease [Variovorax paradoxus]|jgi:carboxyl-terminal processing protease|uniref:S41 family peptidase n=1 Tax=Variovorax paradoxus TaxID=34073 RepID=UPI002790B54D|nr:S41 family peptidase [Variovorax paradoxus]MDQ0573070.1 carboxyl-terminal processing protease [Variovorax paradoxus]